jgi:hypothetical protein
MRAPISRNRLVSGVAFSGPATGDMTAPQNEA